jgi:plastocyanin
VLSRWSLPLALALLLAVPAAAADQSVTAQPSIQWSPDEVTIDIGDTVTWNNGGGIHNVEFNDGSFTRPPAPSEQDWSVPRTFDQPGIFRYHCGFHGSAMSGVVKVRDETGQVPEPVEVDPGLSVSARDEQQLARLVEGPGLLARARCTGGCDIRLKLSLAPRTAKRLGFAKRRVTVGKTSDTLAADRKTAIDVPIKNKVKDELAAAERAFKVRLDVRATNDTRETARKTIKITP